MLDKNKVYKIQVSKLLIVSFVILLLIALALVFSFSKAGAPAPKKSTQKSVTAEPQAENNYNLLIDKINLSAPIISGVDGNDKEAYNKALEGGVAQMMGSALPGKPGNVFIFGHSSYYAWKPGDYKQIFKELNNVEVGDKIKISSNLTNYNYKVTDKKIVGPEDVAVANQNYSEKKLTIMTCWPIGSDAERLIVVGLLEE